MIEGWLSPEEWTAVRLSLLVSVVATGASLPFGVGVAYLLARGRFPGKAVLDALVHLPLILPPVVTGYLLLISFGRVGRSAPSSPITASCSRSAGRGRRSPAP